MADAQVSEACAARHEGSSPSSRTKSFLLPNIKTILVSLKGRLLRVVPTDKSKIINSIPNVLWYREKKSPKDLFYISSLSSSVYTLFSQSACCFSVGFFPNHHLLTINPLLTPGQPISSNPNLLIAISVTNIIL